MSDQMSGHAIAQEEERRSADHEHRIAHLESLEPLMVPGDLPFAVPAITLGLANAEGAADFVIRSDAVLIAQALGFGVGVAPIVGQIHVVQANAAGGIVALKLNQADDSEGFEDYLGNSAASAIGPLSTWRFGNTIQGFRRVEVNGVAQWAPYYDAPTGLLRAATFIVQGVECQVGGVDVVRLGPRGWDCATAVLTYSFANLRIPEDADMTQAFLATPLYNVSATTATNVRIFNGADMGNVGESYTTHAVNVTADIASGIIAIVQAPGAVQIDLQPLGDNNDIVSLWFSRVGTHVNDTFAGTLYFMGWRIQYSRAY